MVINKVKAKKARTSSELLHRTLFLVITTLSSMFLVNSLSNMLAIPNIPIIVMFKDAYAYNLILYNFTTSKHSYYTNESVEFIAHYFAYKNQTVRLLISNNTNFTNCSYYSTNGCFAYSSLTNSSPVKAYKNITTASNYTFYARICSADSCASNTSTLDFHNITKPSEFHKAEQGYRSITSLPSNTMIEGEEATNKGYVNISDDDHVVWITSYTLANVYTFHKFKFNLTSPLFSNVRLRYVGYGESSIQEYYLYVWNFSSQSWNQLYTGSGTTDVANLSLGNDFINNSLVYVLVRSPNSGFTGSSTMYSDYISLTVTTNNSVSIEVKQSNETQQTPQNISNVSVANLTIRYVSNQNFDDYSSVNNNKMVYAIMGNSIIGLASDTQDNSTVSTSQDTITISSSYNIPYYIFFTFLSERLVRNKASLLGSNEITSSMSPNFGIGDEQQSSNVINTITLFLEYNNIVFSADQKELPPGEHSIKIINNGTINRKVHLVLDVLK